VRAAGQVQGWWLEVGLVTIMVGGNFSLAFETNL